VAAENDIAIGCVVHWFLDTAQNKTQLMQMAVETKQGKGVGITTSQ
jgi:hypothetical protein